MITTADKLPAKYVIHTVGPIWKGGNNDEEQLLANCYINSLRVAVENKVETITFPNVSTGVYGFPKELAAKIALEEIVKFLSTNNTIRKITFVCFDDENFGLYSEMMEEY